MKTLTVAELRYLLAQLPPELDDAFAITSVDKNWDHLGRYTVVGLEVTETSVTLTLD